MSFGNQNPYEVTYGSFGTMAVDAKETERAAFIRRTYLHLAGAISSHRRKREEGADCVDQKHSTDGGRGR